jgi:hypothetical protein
VLSSVVVAVIGDFVDRRFLDSWSRCPLDVNVDFGKCLEINSYVHSGQEWKCPFLIASRNVDLTGL